MLCSILHCLPFPLIVPTRENYLRTIKKWTDRWNYFVVGTLSSWSPDNITWWRTWRRVYVDSGPSLYKNKSYCLPRSWERSEYWYFYSFVLDFEAYPFRLSQTFYSIAVYHYFYFCYQMLHLTSCLLRHYFYFKEPLEFVVSPLRITGLIIIIIYNKCNSNWIMSIKELGLS